MLFPSGTVALVTGASKGIGSAIALDLAREGATVVVNFRSDEIGAKTTVAAIEESGGTALACRADVAVADEVRAMFREVRTRFGRLDVLVANAGITADAVMPAMSHAAFDKVIQTNVTGVFLCCQEAVRLMMAGGGGSIVTLGSITAHGAPGISNYAASKGAVVSFTQSVASELGPYGIRANAVSPGLIDTAMAAKMPPIATRLMLDHTPLNRAGRPEEVAHVVSFLASEKASFITGAEIDVSGGARLGLVVPRSEIAAGRTRKMTGSTSRPRVHARPSATPTPPSAATDSPTHREGD